MKKQLVKLLNDSYSAAIVAALKTKFPDLTEIVTSFSIAEGCVTVDYKSQGVKINRVIDSFIENFRVGYIAAMEVITKSQA